jgi:hypothetical protein
VNPRLDSGEPPIDERRSGVTPGSRSALVELAKTIGRSATRNISTACYIALLRDKGVDMSQESLPSWQDPKLGTMKRAALWLIHEVGEGQVFTKAQLRDAFPGVAQADRRMRDLRDFGWQIDTNREDLSLDANEQRFVKAGIAVWEPGKATRKDSVVINVTQRREILSRDGHFCRSCGITPGQTYAGTYEAAQLDIARRNIRLPGGSTEVQLVTECQRCRVGARGTTADLEDLLARLSELTAFERKILANWTSRDAREFSNLEQVWAGYRTLPADSRTRFESRLDEI